MPSPLAHWEQAALVCFCEDLMELSTRFTANRTLELNVTSRQEAPDAGGEGGRPVASTRDGEVQFSSLPWGR